MRIFLHEHVSGGGFRGRPLPGSWAREGSAIRRALAGDFAAVPGVEVVATLDGRIGAEPPRPGVAHRIITDREPLDFARMVAGADATLAVAPEAGGLLAGLARSIAEAGGRSLGSDPLAIEQAADKLGLAARFEALGIPTPPTLPFGPGFERPSTWDGPIVVKPIDGAGSVDTSVIADGDCPDWAREGRRAIAQPFLAGEPLSASFLVDRAGGATLLAVGRQRVEVDARGRISYQGGSIPRAVDFPFEAVEAAVASVPGLLGFVGVDFLGLGDGSVSILEINPRATTSVVGLARLRPPGTLAGAWLAASGGPLGGTDWPARLAAASASPPLIFDADGSIRPERY